MNVLCDLTYMEEYKVDGLYNKLTMLRNPSNRHNSEIRNKKQSEITKLQNDSSTKMQSVKVSRSILSFKRVFPFVRPTQHDLLALLLM